MPMVDASQTKRFWLWLIRLIGVIVPRRLRADWRQEWEAELRCRELLLADWDKLNWKTKIDLLRRSLGAFWDALLLQPRRLEDEMFQDLRYGARLLLKHKGFTAVAVLSLALGIGANTALFSVVDAVLVRPLAFRDSDRLVKVLETNSQRGWSRTMISFSDFVDWKSQSQSFEEMAALLNTSFRVTGVEAPEEVSGNRVSANFFTLLGVKAAIGRTFLPEDEKPNGERAAVLSYKYWVSRSGADPNIVGRTITLNDTPHVIVGVLPADFRETFQSSPGRALIWTAAIPAAEAGGRRGPGGYMAVARLKPDVTIEQARADMAATAERLAQAYPKSNQGIGAAVYSLHEEVTKGTRESLLILLAAVALVLLIACANVASLLLARGVERAKEVAIRLAIGAGRGRVIRQLLTESALLSLLGGALGWLLARWIVAAIVPLIPRDVPRTDEIALGYRALLFAMALSLVASLLFGLSPAFQTARINLTGALKESGGSLSESLRSRWMRHTLVVAQVALTTVLLIGAGLMTASLVRLYRVDPGFNTRNLLTMSVNLPRAKNEVPQQWNSFFSSLTDRALGLPGVQGAAVVVPLPLGDSRYGMKIALESGAENPAGDSVAGYCTVSPAYFRLMGISLLQGRSFTAHDHADSTRVVVVNETLAHAYFPGQEVIGRLLILNLGSKDREKAATIVGVVADSRARLDEKVSPHFYQLASQEPQPSMYLIARTATDPRNLFDAMRSTVFSINQNQPIDWLTTMDEIWAGYTVRPRFYLTLLGSLAALAIVLASTGIYGVLSHTVSQRTHEIGIRRALGAQDGDVLKLVIRQGMILALIGAAAGLIAASLLTRLIRGWLYEVSATDPATFGTVAVALLLVTLLACYVPARRATKVDPMIALRRE
jgi:predicted permease